MNLKYTIICYLLLPQEVQWVLDNQYDYWFRKNIQIIGFLEIEFTIILKMVTRKKPLFWAKIYHCIEVSRWWLCTRQKKQWPHKILLSFYCCQKESKTSLESLGNPSDNIAHQMFTLTIWDWSAAGSREMCHQKALLCLGLLLLLLRLIGLIIYERKSSRTCIMISNYQIVLLLSSSQSLKKAALVLVSTYSDFQCMDST